VEESIAPSGEPVVVEVFRSRAEFGADIKLTVRRCKLNR